MDVETENKTDEETKSLSSMSSSSASSLDSSHDKTGRKSRWSDFERSNDPKIIHRGNEASGKDKTEVKEDQIDRGMETSSPFVVAASLGTVGSSTTPTQKMDVDEKLCRRPNQKRSVAVAANSSAPPGTTPKKLREGSSRSIRTSSYSYSNNHCASKLVGHPLHLQQPPSYIPKRQPGPGLTHSRPPLFDTPPQQQPPTEQEPIFAFEPPEAESCKFTVIGLNPLFTDKNMLVSYFSLFGRVEELILVMGGLCFVTMHDKEGADRILKIVYHPLGNGMVAECRQIYVALDEFFQTLSYLELKTNPSFWIELKGRYPTYMDLLRSHWFIPVVYYTLAKAYAQLVVMGIGSTNSQTSAHVMQLQRLMMVVPQAIRPGGILDLCKLEPPQRPNEYQKNCAQPWNRR